MLIVTEVTAMILLIVFCPCSSANQNDTDGKLDGFFARWASPEDNDPRAFTHLPRTKDQAIEANCRQLENCCQNSSSHYTGIRYICNDTVDAILIYDVQGKIAGIQMAVSKKSADNQKFMEYEHYPGTPEETIFGEKYYVVTTYFIDPRRICVGRTDEEFLEEGTVTNLYVQNGSDPMQDSRISPITEDKSALNSIGFKELACVPTMGLHYTDGFDEGMDCTSYFPLSLMYEPASATKRMTGIAFLIYGNYPNTILEFRPKESLPSFFKSQTVPDCLNEAWGQSGLTTFHVYFVRNPRSIRCSK